ncbi:MAG: ABC transporter permease subunit [Phycisphaerales bacterium]|nr:ABC transporter permease subunit [Phycisphaerales bacterium]
MVTASRRKRHQFIRVLFLTVLAATAALSLLATVGFGGDASLRSLAMAGAFIFEATTLVEIALICLVTPIFMAGAIQQESSPRTWDLLLTTPMSSMGIVVGNLAGRVFFVLALILAGLPILLSLQILGGVNPGSVVLAAAVAAGTACVVGAAAVMLSASRTGGRRAVLWFYTGIVVALALSWIADGSLRSPVPGVLGATGTTWATPLNPFLVLESLLRPARYVANAPLGSSGLVRFWLGQPLAAYLATCGAATLLLIGWAILRVRTLGPLMGRGSTSRRRLVRRPRPVGLNPIAWRASGGRPRSRLEDTARWGWAAAALTVTVVLLSLAGGGSILPTTARSGILIVLLIETSVVILAAIAAASTSITRDREDGTLDLLLTTPIQSTPYLRGKLIGVGRLLTPLLLAPLTTAVLTASVLAASRGEAAFALQTPTGLQPVASWGGLIGFALTLPAFLAFCIAIGLHWSVRSRRSSHAMLASTVIAGLAAGLLIPCVSGPGTSVAWGVTPFVSASPLASIVLAISGPAMLSGSPLGAGGGQWLLVVSGIIAAVGWAAIAMMSLKTTARGFVRTMRQLAGTN